MVVTMVFHSALSEKDVYAMAPTTTKVVIASNQLQALFEALHRLGFAVIGPTIREGILVYEPITRADQLPQGWTDDQEPGHYRLTYQNKPTFFDFTPGSHSWKQFLHPPQVRFWQAERVAAGSQFATDETAPAETPKYAFIGVRACELQAIAVQDRVFLGGAYVDPLYQARREKLFIVALNCTRAGGTCFCASMQSGPQATSGFDLALTEVLEGAEHYFVVETGSAAGTAILEELEYRPARPAEIEAAQQRVAEAARQMGRELDTTGLQEVLYRNHENQRWDEVASRCLTCGNCTMVCPTCFCTDVHDVTDLSGQKVERWRRWTSCFNVDYAYIHGGSLRSSPKARYRQWLTHKLATWQDQFGTSGCVGCGRCITWCPVGIDLTAEVKAIQQSETATAR
jgi:ferredoxin